MNKIDLIGSAEAAILLKIDRATLNRWAAKGLIPTAVRAPGETGPRLFNRADVENFTKKRVA